MAGKNVRAKATKAAIEAGKPAPGWVGAAAQASAGKVADAPKPQPVKMTSMLAAIALDALASRAEGEEKAIKSAFARMQKGDRTAEKDADAAQARLEKLINQMGAIENQLISGRSQGKREIANFLR